MQFVLAKDDDYAFIYDMMCRARAKLIKNGIFQWNQSYPTAGMIRGDIINGYTYLVHEGGKCVGFFITNDICEDDVHGHIVWKYPDAPYLILHRLCVEPDLQSHGLGQKILAEFERQAAAAGKQCVRIDVFGTNAAAIHIYEKFGYGRVGSAVCDRGLFYIYEKKNYSN